MRSQYLLRSPLRRIVAASLILAAAVVTSVHGEECRAPAIGIETTGLANRPIFLGIRVLAKVAGDDAFLLLRDVPADAKLSAGIDVGDGGAWLIPANASEQLAITMPHAGRIRLTAQLLDAKFNPTSAEEPVHLNVVDPTLAAQLGH